MRRQVLRALPLVLGLSVLVAGTLVAQEPQSSDGPTPAIEVSEETRACMSCHAPDAETAPPVRLDKLLESPHAEFGCDSCHPSFTVEFPHTAEMKEEKASCGDCHGDVPELWAQSVHARLDKVPGDHPTCATCHGAGDSHAVIQRGAWTREQKVEVCSQCHRDDQRMARYGPNVEAVDSYDLSFHGKALLKFGNLETAICVDCHGNHSVLDPKNPDSTVHKDNVVKTCAQQSCHPGAGPSFAHSGFNHLKMEIGRQPLLFGIEMFFRVLTILVLSVLMLGIAMDLRRSIFGLNPPGNGRLVGSLVAFGMLSLTVAILLAFFNLRGVFTATGVGIALIALAIVIHRHFKRGHVSSGQKRHPRFGPSLRVQHVLLFTSFTALVFTGMPIRYPNDEFLQTIYMTLGGMPVMRGIHRIAAVVMIVTWIFHSLELLWKWKRAGFSFAAWTMWPNGKDLADFKTTVKGYLGLTKEVPRFDRFQFREKFDYFAVYWGMPIMVISGLILWFPVVAASYLPDAGLGVAYIAHADEAVLAFLTIVTWHFYNTHFNTHNFPMSRVWITGTMTQDEMLRDHPLELERIEAEAKDVPTSEEPE